MLSTPFYLADRQNIRNRFDNWESIMPNVKPYYAVKCNTEIEVIKILDKLGVNFDCASSEEIKLILSLGIEYDRIIFSHPVKTEASIIFAKNNGVEILTFDNKEELFKIHKLYPQCKLLLRIITDDSNSTCPLSNKFGATLDEAFDLLKFSASLHLNIIGVTFHVGSGCSIISPYAKAIFESRLIFQEAKKYDYHFTILDIGGGFTSDSFLAIGKEINNLLTSVFPNIKVIAEPGRYFVSDAFTLNVSVIGKRIRNNIFYFYLDDGLYQSFSGIIFDHQKPIAESDKKETTTYTSVLFGPTCDGLDCLRINIQLPELSIGDNLTFKNMGAYTLASTTNFNGFKDPKVIYIN